MATVGWLSKVNRVFSFLWKAMTLSQLPCCHMGNTPPSTQQAPHRALTFEGKVCLQDSAFAKKLKDLGLCLHVLSSFQLRRLQG